MKISNLFEDAFNFPLSNKKKFLGFGGIYLAYLAIIMAFTFLFLYFDENVLIITIGGILALVVLIILSGYQLRTIKESIEGHQEPPEFNNWAEMFINGFKLGLTELIYLILPILFIFAGLIPIIQSMLNHSIPSFGTGSLILLIIGMALFIIYAFISPIIQANLAYKGFKSAFNIPDILRRISTYGKGKYFLAILLMMMIGLAIGVLSGIIQFVLDMIIPLLGQFITILIFTPFIVLFRSRVVALVYRETLEVQTPEGE
jgi:MFS family permease